MPGTQQDRIAANLVLQAERLLRSGRLDAARNTVAALRHGFPDAPEADEIEARLCMAEGALPDAIQLLDGALDRAPQSATMLLLRAEARALIDDHAGAAADAAEATILEPGDARAKAILGIALIELGQLPDAIACLGEAVRQAPGLSPAWQGLAEAMVRVGDAEAAASVYAAAIENVPLDGKLRLAAVMCAMRARQFELAIELGEAARRAGLADACLFGLLGHAKSKLGHHQAATADYQDALRLAPEDPYVRHLVRAAGMLPGAERAPADYLEAVFDGYAENFDEHLIALGYRMPGEIRDTLIGLIDTGVIPGLGEVLDLGCGTGLVGLLVADLPMAGMTGLDVSENMIAKARDRRIYRDLISADIPKFLGRTERRWNTVLGGDVFCYFGALEAVFADVARVLRPGGVLICNVEHDPGAADWRLEAQGRYVHSQAYVRFCLDRAGLEVLALQPETLRYEGGAPVAGLLLSARRAPHDA